MKIICSAIKDDVGKIWIGKRHSDCLFLMHRFSIPVLPRVEGFVDRYGTFYTRKQAKKIATESGQTIEDHHETDLYSEDLY